MTELTDEQLHRIWLATPTGEWSFARAVVAEYRAQQSARHAEELVAYEVTVGNLRAQREQAQPVAHENCVPVACLVETDSGVMVWPIRNSAEACTYCDPDEIPQMLYLHPATPQAQPGRKPMTRAERSAAYSSIPREQQRYEPESFHLGIDAAEAFHDIKETP